MEKIAWWRMENNKFTNILRMNMKSLYVLFDQSKESNTRTLPSFGCSTKAIQWFMQKYYIRFLAIWIRASAYCNKWLRLHVLDVVWCKYAISHIFPFSHHLWYVECNTCHGIFVKLFFFLNYLLRHLTVLEHIIVVLPRTWPIVPSLANN